MRNAILEHYIPILYSLFCVMFIGDEDKTKMMTVREPSEGIFRRLGQKRSGDASEEQNTSKLPQSQRMMSLNYVIVSRKTDGNIPPLDNTEECSRPSQYSAEDVAPEPSVPTDHSREKKNEGKMHLQRITD
jgi:hypothetical protein